MITPAQVDEWIREAEERPESAALIIRQIARRLVELVERNEQLLDENISLQSGKKVAEYENRISNLEYQLEMLKRQVGGLAAASPEAPEAPSLLLFDADGHILRLLLEQPSLVSSGILANFAAGSLSPQEPPQLLAVDSKEELLFVFDSGRSVTVPVAQIPPAEGGVLDWGQGAFQEPRGGEALVAILPIARMALYEYCLQVSRRGYVKKIRESFLESYIAGGNVGTGVVTPADKTCSLALCAADDLLVIVSKDGSLTSIPVGDLPYTIQEICRLSSGDHVIAAIVLRAQTSFLALTHNGKVFHREADWLAPAEQGKSTGRAILSKARREAGMRIVGAAAVGGDEWGILLTSDGALRLYQVGEMVSAGSLLADDPGLEVLGFAVFSAYEG